MTNPLLFLIIYMAKGNNLMAKNMVQLTNSTPCHGALAKTSHLNQNSNQKSKFSQKYANHSISQYNMAEIC